MTELALWKRDLRDFERELKFEKNEYLKHVRLIEKDIARAKKRIKELQGR